MAIPLMGPQTKSSPGAAGLTSAIARTAALRRRHHQGQYQSRPIGVGPPDRSGNHPAFGQPEFASQPTGVACRGRTRSALGPSDFDTSEAREDKRGAADQGPMRCWLREADGAVARALLFPPAVSGRARWPLLHAVSTVHRWTANSSRCLARYPSDVFETAALSRKYWTSIGSVAIGSVACQASC